MKNDTGQLGVLAEKCAKNVRFPDACGLIEVFGHIRARTCGPTRTRIPPFNLSPRVRAEDFIIIDLDSVQHGTASLLPGQTPSQLEINKSCPDDGSLGGSHAVYPTRFGMSDPPRARPVFRHPSSGTAFRFIRIPGFSLRPNAEEPSLKIPARIAWRSCRTSRKC